MHKTHETAVGEQNSIGSKTTCSKNDHVAVSIQRTFGPKSGALAIGPTALDNKKREQFTNHSVFHKRAQGAGTEGNL
jgi:hypothetical protein